jgi:putative copper resistance protein D
MLTTLPPDILAFFAVILRGLQLTAQSVILGGVLFLLGFTRPLAPKLGRGVVAMERTGLDWTAKGGLALVVVAGLSIFANLAQLVAGLEIHAHDALGADFVQWNIIMAVAALALAVTARMAANPAQVSSLALLAVVVLGASVMSSHAFARVEEREYYILADALHQAGASLWIGGIPFMLLALSHVSASKDRLLVGMRFSHLFTGAVGLLLVGAAMLAWGYISTPGALIGTAYGIMTGAKITLLAVLLFLAAMNRKSTRSEAADKGQFRLRRFAEVEIGIGITVLMIAASMASQPPAADQTQHQASIMEIVERMAPTRAPRLVSPDSSTLTLVGMEKSQATEIADRMWSEFNHNWAGIFVLAMGLGAVAHRMGVGPARHWPLLFLVIGVAIIIRSDPESWPIGPKGFFEALEDPEVFQHRVVGLLLFPFGLFEWGVRTGRLRSERAKLIFPILCAVGAGLLLVHNHTLTDVKERFLIEFSHIPMGLCGVMSGWLRWLEIRGDGRARRIAGALWPLCFSMVGLLLIFYRELP